MVHKIISLTYYVLKRVNTTVWGGIENTKKVSTVVKSGLSFTDT